MGRRALRLTRCLVAAVAIGSGALVVNACGGVLGILACNTDDNCPEGQTCRAGRCGAETTAEGEGEGEGEGEEGTYGAHCNNLAFEVCVGDLVCSSQTGSGSCVEPCTDADGCEQCALAEGAACACVEGGFGSHCEKA